MKELLIVSIIAVSSVIAYLSYVLWQECQQKRKKKQQQQEVADRMEILEEMEEEFGENDFNEPEVEKNEPKNLDDNAVSSVDSTDERAGRSSFADYS